MLRPHLVPLLLLAACVEPLPDDTPYVDAPRVLAVRFDPPEVVPGGGVRLTTLLGTPDGTAEEASIDWSWCLARKPLAELGPVAPACIEGVERALDPIGDGLVVTGVVPADACALFGPNPPPPVEDEPPGRPVDPDVTGGFHQPVIGTSDLFATPVLAGLRIRCGLANVSQETYIAWNLGYQSNTNPIVDDLRMGTGEDAVSVPREGAGEPPVVRAGEVVPLEVSWPACPIESTCGDGVCGAGEEAATCPEDCTAPVACGGAETYIVFDPATRTLVPRREAISVAWLVTDGELSQARGGREGDEAEATAATEWTAPDRAGDATLWVVLRDERGGTDFASFTFRVVE